MQSLRDYLSNTQQYESILDPDQDQVINRMTDATDDMIRKRIKEYCTWDRQKYNRGELWPAVDADLKITKLDKDKLGWYVETKTLYTSFLIYSKSSKTFYDYCLSEGQKIDKQKGFLIEDIGVYFRWRKHEGGLTVVGNPDFESTEGLPEKLSSLTLSNSCQESGRLAIHNEINLICLDNVGDINLNMTGRGCKNVIIHPHVPINVTAPNDVKIYHPKDINEYRELRIKLSKH